MIGFGFIFGSLVTIGVQYGWYIFQQKKRALEDDQEITRRSTTQRANAGGGPPSSIYDTISGGGLSQSGFLTELLSQLWYYINIAGCKIVKETVEPMFATMLPGPLASLHFTKLELGNIPLRLDNIVVHQVDKKNATIQLELDIVWDGQCDIKLKADYIGSIGVQHVKLSGRMNIILKPLTDAIPIVQAVQCAFVNPPTLSLDFTGLAQVADLKIIDNTVRNIIQTVLQGLMVLPTRMVTRLDDGSTPFYQIYQPPLGIARITVLRGRGFQIEKRTVGKDDIPDVYCKMSIGTTSWTTSVVKDSLEPVWNETYDVVLYDHDQLLHIHAWDKDSGKLDSDDDLGYSTVSIGEILLATGRMKEVELLSSKEKATGAYIRVCADLCPFTTSNLDTLQDHKQKKLLLKQSEENEKKDHLIYAVVMIAICRVNNIPVKDPKDSNCFIKVDYGPETQLKENITTFQTAIVPGLDPIFDMAFLVPITEEITSSDITFTLLNTTPTSESSSSKNKAGHQSLGTAMVYHQHLLDAPNHTITENRPIGTQGVSIEYQVKLSGIQIPDTPSKENSMVMTHSITPSVPSTTQTTGIGEDISCKLMIKSCKGLKVLKNKLRPLQRDIPDCYVKVRVGSIAQIWRTATIKNSIEPIWNESKQYDCVRYDMVISLEVLDEDNGIADKKDDLIGTTRISVGKLLYAGSGHDVELELQDKKGKDTGIFITVACEKVQSATQNNPQLSSDTNNKIEKAVPASLEIPRLKLVNEPVPAPSEISIPKLVNEPIPASSEISSPKLVKEPVSSIPVELSPAAGNEGSIPRDTDRVTLRLHIVRGRNFPIEKKKLRKDDIPDCYCQIKVVDCSDSMKSNKKDTDIWKTSTIKNNSNPVWNNERKEYHDITYGSNVMVEVWDEDDGIRDPDDFLGYAEISIRRLIEMNTKEIELVLLKSNKDKTPNGSYVTIKSEIVTA